MKPRNLIMAALTEDLTWALSLGKPVEMQDIAVPVVYPALGAAMLNEVHADATRITVSRPGGWPLTLRMRRDALAFAFSPDPERTALRLFFCQQANLHPDRLRSAIVRDIGLLLAGARRIARTGAVRGVEEGEEPGSSHASAEIAKARPQSRRGSYKPA